MKKTQLLSVVLFLFVLGCIRAQDGDEQGSEEKTTRVEYQDLVEDVLEGRNHYETLDVTETATSSEVRRAFRNLTLIYHPDKIKLNFITKEEQEKALEFYFKIQRAYEVLSNKNLRAQYDDLRENGVPWKDQHYHRYVHKYWRGAPEHDPLVVLFYFVLSLTIFHYYYVRHRYNKIINYAKRTTRYKRLKNELQGEEDEPVVVFSGLTKPIWYEILPYVVVVRSAKLIKSLFLFIVSIISRKKLTPEEIELENKRKICEKYGWSEEEYQEQVQRSMRKQQELMNSNKMKRYRRFMKQRGAR